MLIVSVLTQTYNQIMTSEQLRNSYGVITEFDNMPYDDFVKFVDTVYSPYQYPHLHLMLVSNWCSRDDHASYRKFKYLTRRYYIINTPNDFNGITVLFIPRRLHKFRRLMKLRARLNVVDDQGVSVMMHHYMKHHTEIFQWLCEQY